MKSQARALVVDRVSPYAAFADYLELAKPRISLLVTLTGAVGFFMGSRGAVSAWGLVHTMIGVMLVSAAANTLNQILERTPDAQMRRTARRPIPTGRIRPEHATRFAAILGIGGALYCALFLNPLTAAIAAATLLSYSFVYTPLKRKTVFNTLIGAVPGALPPLGGWTAASGRLEWGGVALFLIVFFWQIPHFLSIAWLLRAEYAKAGFRMLPVVDREGTRTGRHIVVTGVLLVPAAALPVVLGMTGAVYLGGAILLSAVYAGLGISAARGLTTATARRLFLGSLLYLPALLILMMADKLTG